MIVCISKEPIWTNYFTVWLTEKYSSKRLKYNWDECVIKCKLMVYYIVNLIVLLLHYNCVVVWNLDFLQFRYVKSRSDEQLRKNSSINEVSSCKPEDNVNGQPIVPCGLIAWSLFNDTYNFQRNNQQLIVNKKGISWSSDRKHKFGKNVFPRNFQNGILKGGAQLNSSIPVSFTSLIYNWSFIPLHTFKTGFNFNFLIQIIVFTPLRKLGLSKIFSLDDCFFFLLFIK